MDHSQYDTVAIAPAVSRVMGAAIIAPTQNILVALQCLDGQAYLTSTPITSTSAAVIPDNADIVQHLRAVHDRMTVDDKHESWLSQRFTKTVVGTAELQQILPPSSRAQCSCHRVYLSNFSYHWILTETFNNPETILHGKRLIQTVYNVQLDNNSITVVITLQKLLDKWKVAQALIVMLLVLSPTLGWLVGHLSDSAEAGIAVSAGVFMVASFVQGLTAWMVG